MKVIEQTSAFPNFPFSAFFFFISYSTGLTVFLLKKKIMQKVDYRVTKNKWQGDELRSSQN